MTAVPSLWSCFAGSATCFFLVSDGVFRALLLPARLAPRLTQAFFDSSEVLSCTSYRSSANREFFRARSLPVAGLPTGHVVIRASSFFRTSRLVPAVAGMLPWSKRDFLRCLMVWSSRKRAIEHQARENVPRIVQKTDTTATRFFCVFSVVSQGGTTTTSMSTTGSTSASPRRLTAVGSDSGVVNVYDAAALEVGAWLRLLPGHPMQPPIPATGGRERKRDVCTHERQNVCGGFVHKLS